MSDMERLIDEVETTREELRQKSNLLSETEDEFKLLKEKYWKLKENSAELQANFRNIILDLDRVRKQNRTLQEENDKLLKEIKKLNDKIDSTES